MPFIKPNFFVPGAGKSGTSSLHEYLNMHPDIFMSKIKEPHFFSDKKKFYSEFEKKKYYALFNEGKNIKYRGESSTGYLVFPKTVERIRKEIDDPKFIFLLRNPIDRIFSHYNWVDSLVGEELSFEDAIIKDKNEEPNHLKKFGSAGYKYYFQIGLYGKWLEQFYNNFDKKSILIILTEDLKEDPLTTINKCYEFLNISKLESIGKINTNKTVYYKDTRIRNKMVKLFSSSVLNKKVDNRHLSFVINYLRQTRSSIYTFVKNNFLIDKSPKKLTLDQRKWLKNSYSNDVGSLKKLTGLKLTKWKDFN